MYRTILSLESVNYSLSVSDKISKLTLSARFEFHRDLLTPSVVPEMQRSYDGQENHLLFLSVNGKRFFPSLPHLRAAIMTLFPVGVPVTLCTLRSISLYQSGCRSHSVLGNFFLRLHWSY